MAKGDVVINERLQMNHDYWPLRRDQRELYLPYCETYPMSFLFGSATNGVWKMQNNIYACSVWRESRFVCINIAYLTKMQLSELDYGP